MLLRRSLEAQTGTGRLHMQDKVKFNSAIYDNVMEGWPIIKIASMHRSELSCDCPQS